MNVKYKDADGSKRDHAFNMVILLREKSQVKHIPNITAVELKRIIS